MDRAARGGQEGQDVPKPVRTNSGLPPEGEEDDLDVDFDYDPDEVRSRMLKNWRRMRAVFLPYKSMIAEAHGEEDYDEHIDDIDHHHFVVHNEAYDPVHRSMIENGLSQTEIVAFFEGYGYNKKKVEELEEEVKELRKSLSEGGGAGGGGDGVSGSRMRDMSNRIEKLSAARLSAEEKSGAVPPRPNLKDTLYDSKAKRSGKGKFINQSCKTLSMKKILNDPNLNSDTERVLRELMEVERKQKKLEKQLQSAGVTIAEDIPYEEAKRKVQEIGKRMGEIGSSQVEHEDKLVQAKLREEYFRLEQDMEKYNNALMLTDEYIKEQEDKEREWEETNQEANLEALKKIRRHMPVEVKNTSEAQLSSQATPNGKVLPKDIAKKFKRTDVLMLLRTNPNDIERVHPSTVENLRVTGLTLTERRAIHEHLKGIGEKWKKNKAEKMTERKWTWFNTMRNNFKENLAQYDRHVGQYGPPESHPYATRKDPNAGCPLIGRQCPLRADKNPSYDDDYGYPDGAEYVESFVTKADAEDTGAKAQREAQELARAKKATARQDELKKHYKGKILEVSKANGSCEAMDEAMDRIESRQIGWIEARVTDGSLDGKNVDDSGRRKETAEFNDALNELKLSVLQFAEKSGMQLTGKKDASADKGDNRSAIELGLSEDVYGVATDFIKGIEERMEQIKAVDGLMKSSIKQLRELLEELHERSLNTLKKLGCEKPAASRKWKSREDLLKEAKEKLAPEEEAAEEVVEDYAAPPVPPMGGRGGLMDEIAGRGRGGGGGRGDLLGAIAARGGGRGRGGRDAGGRGDLLGAIAARGRGGGGRDAGGRGDLLGAIAARGRGGAGRDAGGRGDLLGAIAARGRGGAGRDVGGRGDLLGAIAARGRGGAGRDAGGRADLLGAIAARGRGGGGRDAGGRADLLGAIAARGGAARGGGGRDTGRADLLGAIAARGRGGERGGNGRSARGGLMADIAARGRAGERGGRGGGARGGLMAEIAARGRAGERGGNGRSARGGLMAEIAARGRAGERGGSGRSARGGLMAEIAARGQAGGRENGSQRNVGGGRGVQSGLMAEIQARGGGGQGEGNDSGGRGDLMAEITAKGQELGGSQPSEESGGGGLNAEIAAEGGRKPTGPSGGGGPPSFLAELQSKIPKTEE